jgi:hypothetical protein
MGILITLLISGWVTGWLISLARHAEAIQVEIQAIRYQGGGPTECVMLVLVRHFIFWPIL